MTAGRRGAIPERAAGELSGNTLTDRSVLGDELTASGARPLTHFGLHSRAAWNERVDETCQR